MPDLIVGDEIQNLRNRSSGRSKKIKRFFDAHDTAFVGMTGGIVHRSTMDYGHLFGWGLRDKSPLPESIEELKTKLAEHKFQNEGQVSTAAIEEEKAALIEGLTASEETV